MRTTDRGRLVDRGRGLSATGRATSSVVGATGRLIDMGDPFYYAQQYGILYWFRADQGIQYGGTLRASGTAPPAWTITGTATRQVGLHMEIDNVGAGTALGQATYKWSEDNGSTYVATGVVTAAGPTALGTTGLSVAMAVGPYNIDNKWDITVSQWNDVSGAGNHAVMATAGNQPLFSLVGWNGLPCLLWEGDRRLLTPATVHPGTLMIALSATTGARRFWNRPAVDVGSANGAVEPTSRLLPPESGRTLVTTMINAGRMTYCRTFTSGNNASHALYTGGLPADVTVPSTGDAAPTAQPLSIGSGSSGGTNFLGQIREVIGYVGPVTPAVVRSLHLGMAARAPGSL